jgi:hypothetical protein
VKSLNLDLSRDFETKVKSLDDIPGLKLKINHRPSTRKVIHEATLHGDGYGCAQGEGSGKNTVH